MKLIMAKDYRDLSMKAANIIAAQVTLNPKSVLGLATGSTPVGTYDSLINKCENNELDFSEITTVNLDEYYGLSPQNSNSYRYFMDKNLFNHINIKKGNTHVPDGIASNSTEECKRYEDLIQLLGGIDLQLLGIGHNGHIGFNEPSDAFKKNTHHVMLTEKTLEANARFFPNGGMPESAITMGIGTIMSAKKILLIASGDDKAEIIKKALFGEITPQVPASILQLHSDLTVICDRIAD